MDVSHHFFGFKVAVVHALQGLQPVHPLVVFLYIYNPRGGHRQIPPWLQNPKNYAGQRWQRRLVVTVKQLPLEPPTSFDGCLLVGLGVLAIKMPSVVIFGGLSGEWGRSHFQQCHSKAIEYWVLGVRR